MRGVRERPLATNRGPLHRPDNPHMSRRFESERDNMEREYDRDSRGYHRRDRDYQSDDRAPKRRRYDEHQEAENRLRSLIVRVGIELYSCYNDLHKSGEKGAAVEKNLEGLVDTLQDDLARHKEAIIKTIFEWFRRN